MNRFSGYLRRVKRRTWILAATLIGILAAGMATALSKDVSDFILMRLWATFQGLLSTAPTYIYVLVGALVLLVVVGLSYVYRRGISEKHAQQDDRQATAVRDALDPKIEGLDRTLSLVKTAEDEALQEARRQSERLREVYDRLQDIERALPLLGFDDELGSTVNHPPHDEALLTPTPHFVGREDDLEWLTSRLLSPSAPQGDIAVVGAVGVGKTALVSAAIQAIRAEPTRMDGGIAVVRCMGVTDPIQLIRLSLQRFDPRRRWPVQKDIAILCDLANTLLKGMKAILVWDGLELANMFGNGEGHQVSLADMIAVFRAEESDVRILITTSHALPPNVIPPDSARTLEPLSLHSASELFATLAGLGTLSSLPDTHVQLINQIVTSLGRNALTIVSVAGRVKIAQIDLQVLAHDLQQPQEHQTGEILDHVFSVLGQTLDGLPEDPRRLIIGLAVFGTEEAGRNAVRALARGIGIEDPEDAIYALAQRLLVTLFRTETMLPGSDQDRVQVHPVWQQLIAQRMSSWSTADVQTAYTAVASYYDDYLKTVHESGLSADERNITHILDWAIASTDNTAIAHLAYGMRIYWQNRWLTDKSRKYLPYGIEAAETLAKQTRARDDRIRAADLALFLGRVHRRTGNMREAEEAFLNDLRFRRSVRPRDLKGEAIVLHQLGQLARTRGRMREAQRWCEQGLKLAITIGSRHTEGLLRAQLGRIARARGQLAIAEAGFLDALQIFKEVGDRLETGVALGYLGRIARTRGQLVQAELYFKQSLDYAEDSHDQRGVGTIITQQARIARTRGDLAEAQALFERGLNITLQVGDQQTEGVNRNYLGRLALSEGKDAVAERYFVESQTIAKRIEDLQTEAVAIGYLGRVAKKRGDLDTAEHLFRQSLAMLQNVEDARGIGLILTQLGRLELDRFRTQKHTWVHTRLRRAERYLTRSLKVLVDVEDRRSQATTLTYLGDCAKERANRARAKEYLDAALLIANAMEDAEAAREAQNRLDAL